MELGLFFLQSSNLKKSFQAGVDSIYNKCVSCGSTPTAKTPSAIVTAIANIYTNRYNTGYNAGKAAGSASKIIVDGVLALSPSSSYNTDGSFRAIYTKNSSGSWVKSGTWSAGLSTIGGAMKANGASVTINSISVS